MTIKYFEPYPLKKVTILGLGQSAMQFINHSYNNLSHFGSGLNEGVEVWTLNYGAAIFNHDLAWQMHYLLDVKANCPQLIEFTAKLPRVVTTEPWVDLPNAQVFPICDTIEYFQDSWFTHSVAYMIAGAIRCLEMYEGKEQPVLDIFGVDMDSPNCKREYWEQGKDCVTWWMKEAKHRGIKVGGPPTTTLLDTSIRIHGPSLYGYKEQPRIILNEEERVVASWE